MKNVKNTFKIKIILLNIIFFTSFFSQYVSAQINFEGCYMPWEFGDAEKSYIYVRPLGDKCHKICENQCREFSQPSEFDTTNCENRDGSDCYQLAKNNVINSLTGAQLNQDIIEDCMVNCRQGKTFSSDYRVADDSQSSIFGWKWADKTITTNTACVVSKSDKDGSNDDNDETVNYGYFPISYDVKNGDKVTFSLGDSGTQYGNTLFLCGFQTEKITPKYWYVDPNDTSVNFNNKNANKVWNVRNTAFYHTDIPLKNGYYLRFAYGGKVFGYYGDQNIGNKFPYISELLYSDLKFYYDPQRADLDLSFNGKCSGSQNYFPGDQMSTCYYNADQQKSYCITKDNKTIECKNGSCGGLSYDNIQDKSKMCSLRSTRNNYVKKNVDINGFSVSNMPLDKFEFSGYLNNYEPDDEKLQIKYKDDYILTTQCTPNREKTGDQCVDWDHWPNCGMFHKKCCVRKVPIYKYTKECNYFIDGKYYQHKTLESNESEYNQGYTSFDQTVARNFSKNFGGYEVEIN